MKKQNDRTESLGRQEAIGVGRSVMGCPDLLFLVGPSAVGKSAVALELARLIQGEIVSCDAMQVYKEIQVASDKPSREMREAVPHHLLDVVSVADSFNVAQYRELALKAIADISARHRIPIICGGSGMYMMALLDGVFENGKADSAVREKLARELAEKGLPALYAQLRAVDPASADKIKPGDRQRILRALEVFESTGVPIVELQKQRDGLWGKRSIRVVGLERPREEVYARVEARVEEMFRRGLVDEVGRVLRQRLTPTVARLIGIPEVAGYLAGAYDLERAQYLVKRNTRHYVKRQLTWFRKDQRLQWVGVGREELPSQVAARIVEFLRTSRE